ncbi:MAG: hypothetical protein AAF560_20925 [Acidobacteriota bacterium]
MRTLETSKIPDPVASRAVRLSLVLALLMATVGCQKAEEPASPPVRVENASLGVAIAALSPDDFVVTSSNGAAIELAPSAEGAVGKVSVVAGEAEIGGINLVEAVKQHKAEIVARPDGDYKGSTEYMSPLGTTFASRGRYTEDGGTVEERIIYMVHPWGDRTLKVIYTYPAAEDTQERLDALMSGVIGELEGLPVPSEASPEPQESESAG